MSKFPQMYQSYMDLAQTDPIQAAKDFRDSLKATKKPSIQTIRILDRIINGDESVWHSGAKDLTDAVQFVISNAMLKSLGLGVMNMQAEDIIHQIGGIITEDNYVAKLGPIQKRCMVIAESYGLQPYALVGSAMTERPHGYNGSIPLSEGPAMLGGPKAGLSGFMIYHNGKPADLDMQEASWNSHISAGPYPVFVNQEDANYAARKYLTTHNIRNTSEVVIRPTTISVGKSIPVNYPDQYNDFEGDADIG